MTGAVESPCPLHPEASAGLTELQDWALVEANGISDDGHVVSGIGINPDGQEEAFIATVCGQIRR